MKKVILLLILCSLFTNSFSQQKRDFLQKESDDINLEKTLVRNFSEIGFPGYSNRTFWGSLPEAIKKEYINEAEKALSYDWPVIKATDYLEIIRSGDRRQQVYAPPRAALVSLVMGELVEGKGRFLDQIINGSWYYSEQTWWGWSAHLTAQKAPHGLPDADEPVIDLGVGEIANVLSWTWFLFKDEFDKVHPLISKRLKDEIMKKVVIPYYERDDFWWMGLTGSRTVNNWNPWTNHNMLTCILILEDNEEKRISGVKKVVRSLDAFTNSYPADGGCDEGPSYWGRAGASLYQNLDLLKRATVGKFDIYDNTLISNMGSYIVKAYINYPYFINFADADATTGSRPDIIFAYGQDIHDPMMTKLGTYLAKQQKFGEEAPGGKIDEQILQLMRLKEITSSSAENVLVSDFWLPQTEVAGARDKGGSTDGFFFAAKGGHNAESHNHNDLGSCIVYYNGKPCLIDLGRETYTAKTFSSKRYEIWTMQSQYHNLPKINGVDQLEGATFKARNTSFTADAKKATFSTDIAGAYPEAAGVKKWIRGYRLERNKQFRITDDYELSTVSKEPTTLNFVTYCKVEQVSPGSLLLKGDGFDLIMKYNSKRVTPSLEYTEVTDAGLKRYWPNGVTRIVFTLINPGTVGKNEITLIKSGS